VGKRLLLGWASGIVLASKKGDFLRLVGCLLLLSGFFILLAALVLLTALSQRLGFVAAGLAIEGLGLALLMQGHMPVEKEQG
jgi:hypothetical protein